jgi:integrase/recombinase XerD
MADLAPNPSFPALLQRFFVEHLRQQRAVSPSTVAAYRDTFRLLLLFAQKRIGKTPTQLALRDLDAALILAFLDHLERERGNSVRSRNARLSAVRSFLKYAAH